MNKWQDPSLTLGERCIAFADNEMNNGVKEDALNSYTSPRLKEYFKICTRLVNGKETPIGATFTSGNWCAAGVSFCLHESLLPGEKLPHGYRLGVVEVVSDLQRNGLYRPVVQVRSGAYSLKVGDPIIFDRSNPSNPDSKWWRHIGRVYSISNNGDFVCISGNNGGRWRLSNHKLSQTTLLGFGEYPTSHTVKQAPDQVPIDWSTFNISDLAPSQDTGEDLEGSKSFDLINDLLNKKD